MQFSRVFPPHVSSAVFLAGRVTHRKNTGTQCSLYLNSKGKHFSLEFGLQRLTGGLRITMGKRSNGLSIGLCRGWNLYRLKCFLYFCFFFLPNFFFLSKPLWSFLDEKVPRLLRTFLGKKRWMLEMESWCGHYESLPFITSETISRALSFLQISAALSQESLSLLDSSFRIMQWWEMGRLHVRGLCTHACGNVHALSFLTQSHCIWDAKHISKDRNCYFHSLLKHKKANYSRDIPISSWSPTQNRRFKEIFT